MAILRVKDVTEMDAENLQKRMGELQKELRSEKGLVAAGGRAVNPGRIREIRRTIARIITIAAARKVSLVPKAKETTPAGKPAAPAKEAKPPQTQSKTSKSSSKSSKAKKVLALKR